MDSDPAIKNEQASLYMQVGFSAVAVVFFICCMVFGYLPPVAAIPLIVAVLNQWLRSPIDSASANIRNIQAMKTAQTYRPAYLPDLPEAPHVIIPSEVKNG